MPNEQRMSLRDALFIYTVEKAQKLQDEAAEMRIGLDFGDPEWVMLDELKTLLKDHM